jgi:anti-anti-sigma factor
MICRDYTRGETLVAELITKRLEGRTAVEARTYLHRLADRSDNMLLIDMSHIEFMGSEALGVLVSAIKRTSGRLGAYGLNPQVRELLHMTRMDRILPIYDSAEAALISL